MESKAYGIKRMTTESIHQSQRKYTTRGAVHGRFNFIARFTLKPRYKLASASGRILPKKWISSQARRLLAFSWQLYEHTIHGIHLPSTHPNIYPLCSTPLMYSTLLLSNAVRFAKGKFEHRATSPSHDSNGCLNWSVTWQCTSEQHSSEH